VAKNTILNGEKMSVRPPSDDRGRRLIWAKVDDEGDKVRGFLVENRTGPVLGADDIHGKWSLRARLTSVCRCRKCTCRVESAAAFPEA